jgi:hypothetical protein
MITEIYTGSEAISIADRNTLEDIFTSDLFPWYYNPTTIGDNKINRSQFTHRIYLDDTVCSDHYSLIHDIFSRKIPEFETHKLTRIKANLNIAHSNRRTLPPHRDLDGKEGVIYIYYVNDSDGSTILYDERKKIKVYPKKGKLIRFPATTWHTGNVPRKNDRRIVINFVFEPLT